SLVPLAGTIAAQLAVQRPGQAGQDQLDQLLAHGLVSPLEDAHAWTAQPAPPGKRCRGTFLPINSTPVSRPGQSGLSSSAPPTAQSGPGRPTAPAGEGRTPGRSPVSADPVAGATFPS